MKKKGSVSASDNIQVHAMQVNVRVKNVNRLSLPGSFSVHLLKDGEVIASKAFFQDDNPETDEKVMSEPDFVHFDFKIPISEIGDGIFETWIEPVDKSIHGTHFPHELAGNPTVNVRLMLSS